MKQSFSLFSATIHKKFIYIAYYKKGKDANQVLYTHNECLCQSKPDMNATIHIRFLYERTSNNILSIRLTTYYNSLY
ncbi:hypothetical protein EMIT0210MI2_10145 [Priestia megaterium]